MIGNELRIVIADDHKMISESLERLIEAEEDMNVIGLACNGLEVMELLEEHEVDVLLLDISMPKMDGLEVLEAMRKNRSKTKVLVMTSHDDGELIREIMQSGAMGYLLKTETSDLLINSIRKVARNEKVLNLSLTSKMIDNMQAVFKKTDIEVVDITLREKEVLNLLSEGMTSQEIGKTLFISENTVISHKKNLYSKFGVSNSSKLVKNAMIQGHINIE